MGTHQSGYVRTGQTLSVAYSGTLFGSFFVSSNPVVGLPETGFLSVGAATGGIIGEGASAGIAYVGSEGLALDEGFNILDDVPLPIELWKYSAELYRFRATVSAYWSPHGPLVVGQTQSQDFTAILVRNTQPPTPAFEPFWLTTLDDLSGTYDFTITGLRLKRQRGYSLPEFLEGGEAR